MWVTGEGRKARTHISELIALVLAWWLPECYYPTLWTLAWWSPEISVLTSKFTALDGKTYYVPNSILLTRPRHQLQVARIADFHSVDRILIVSFSRRSNTCVWKTPVTMGFNTTRAQIEELHQRIEGYLASKPREWSPDCSFNMDSASVSA